MSAHSSLRILSREHIELNASASLLIDGTRDTDLEPRQQFCLVCKFLDGKKKSAILAYLDAIN
jgi:hypothetical protein